jgi:hypothetical protein
MADPVRDLNNFLQGQPGGNATRDFKWLSAREGPEHDTVYHVTAVCKHCDNISLLFIHSYTQVRGVNVGVGHGSTKSIAKRNASLQALEYLKTHGEVPPTTPIGRISDLEIFSTAGIVTEREILRLIRTIDSYLMSLSSDRWYYCTWPSKWTGLILCHIVSHFLYKSSNPTFNPLYVC